MYLVVTWLHVYVGVAQWYWWALDTSGPGFDSTRGNTFFLTYFFGSFFFPVIFFFQTIITSHHETIKNILQDLNFLVLVSVFTHLQKMFSHICQEHRKTFGQKIVWFEGCGLNKIQLHRSFTVFE